MAILFIFALFYDIIADMKNWEELKNILDSQNISSEDQQLIRDFFTSFSFQKRQQLMGVFTGFPEKTGLFITLLTKKVAFARNPTEALGREILDMESKEMRDLMKEIG